MCASLSRPNAVDRKSPAWAYRSLPRRSVYGCLVRHTPCLAATPWFLHRRLARGSSALPPHSANGAVSRDSRIRVSICRMCVFRVEIHRWLAEGKRSEYVVTFERPDSPQEVGPLGLPPAACARASLPQPRRQSEHPPHSALDNPVGEKPYLRVVLAHVSVGTHELGHVLMATGRFGTFL